MPAFGGNRNNAGLVGKLLENCGFVGVPFAGGMAELWEIEAGNIVVNDLHCHIINLARAVQHGKASLAEKLSPVLFHPAELKQAQDNARRAHKSGVVKKIVVDHCGFDGDLARDYFVSQWMGRSGRSSTSSEFGGGVSCRWNANGGGSGKRFRSSILMLDQFEEISKRCEFRCMDALEFIKSIADDSKCGIYCDPPWWKRGKPYEHNVDDDTFHRTLRDLLLTKEKTTRVVRYGRCDAIDELYPTGEWTSMEKKTKTQAGSDQTEVLFYR